MAWFPGAIRKEVARHRTPMERHRAICNHIAVSEGASLFNYFNQPGNPTSHFYVRYDGDTEQYVDTKFRAPANLEGNPTLISIETQGGRVRGQKWTAAQLETLARIYAWAHRIHGIPLIPMPSSRPGATGIGYHRLGVDPWRVDGGEKWSKAYGKTCPEDQRIAQIPGIITRAKQLLAPPPPEDDMAMTDAQAASIDASLKAIAAAAAKQTELLTKMQGDQYLTAVRMDSLVNKQFPELRTDTEEIKSSAAAIAQNTEPSP